VCLSTGSFYSSKNPSIVSYIVFCCVLFAVVLNDVRLDINEGNEETGKSSVILHVIIKLRVSS
jgi:hypothetical protein